MVEPWWHNEPPRDREQEARDNIRSLVVQGVAAVRAGQYDALHFDVMPSEIAFVREYMAELGPGIAYVFNMPRKRDRPLVADDLRPHEAYLVKNQGTSITPQTIRVDIDWVGPGAVHYHKQGDPTIHETTVDRFLEIVNQ